MYACMDVSTHRATGVHALVVEADRIAILLKHSKHVCKKSIHGLYGDDRMQYLHFASV